MSDIDNDLSTFEYKFTFCTKGSAISSERHFSATIQNRREMFNFACNKDGIQADEVDLLVWSRWANRWEIYPLKIQGNPDTI